MPEAVRGGAPGGGPSLPVAIRTPEAKLIREAGGAESWYRLDADPRELKDLKEEQPVAVAAAQERLKEALGGSFPSPPYPALDPGQKIVLRALDAAR